MNQKITKLLSVLAGMAFVCLSVSGQSRVEICKIAPLELKQSMRVQADVPIDSSITYAATGEKTAKTIYSYDEQGRVMLEEIFKWENNNWENDEKATYEYDTNGDARKMISGWESGKWEEDYAQMVYKKVIGIHHISDNRFYCNSFLSEYGVHTGFEYGFSGDGWTYWGYRSEEIRDSKGNLTRLIMHVYRKSNPEDSYMVYDHHITYNDRNFPVLIKAYDADEGTLFRTDRYEYDAYGNVTLYECTEYERNFLYTASYDAKGNLISGGTNESKTVTQIDSEGKIAVEKFYTFTDGRWYMTHYTVHYPNALAPNITPVNNNPVNGNNIGGFDVNINIPADSIAGGSFVIRLPEGFTLDRNNTKLTVDFGHFDLIMTPQENNSWLLELKSKTIRSAALRAEEVSKVLAHIAYTVDEGVKNGDYDITMHSILFETPGGNTIPEPAITMSVQLNRNLSDIDKIGTSDIKAYISGQTLIIDSQSAESIEIYSVSGVKLYSGSKSVGKIVIPISNLSAQVLIVRGGSGWTAKVKN